jgi:hypothetical protein
VRGAVEERGRESREIGEREQEGDPFLLTMMTPSKSGGNQLVMVQIVELLAIRVRMLAFKYHGGIIALPPQLGLIMDTRMGMRNRIRELMLVTVYGGWRGTPYSSSWC